MGIGTTLCYTHSAIFEYYNWKGLEQREAEEERNEITKEEFAIYDQVH
jgi:hypothetical protein